MNLVPVIMCGGAGTRLWPFSRAAAPKQFLGLVSSRTMLAETAARLDLARIKAQVGAPVVICGSGQESSVQRDLAAVGRRAGEILIEPIGRNTAAVAAIAALRAAESDAEALVLLLPADHHIGDPAAFWRSVDAGLPAAAEGYLVTLGIEAQAPETGYGYIRRGERLSEGVYKVREFKEKPDAETASRYLATGEYDWNAGIFLFRASTMIDAFKLYAPDILASCSEAISNAKIDGTLTWLDPGAFAACESAPVDTSIMEKASQVAVVAPVQADWNDVGSWDALAEINEAHGRIASHNVITLNSRDCLIETDGPLVAAIGLEDIIVVATGDAVLIARRGMSQEVKAVVNELKSRGRRDLL